MKIDRVLMPSSIRLSLRVTSLSGSRSATSSGEISVMLFGAQRSSEAGPLLAQRKYVADALPRVGLNELLGHALTFFRLKTAARNNILRAAAWAR